MGLNELEGAVLIDAEDYRRMVQEVKTLKTMLLRLKRELSTDVSEVLIISIIINYYYRERPHLLLQPRPHLWYYLMDCILY